jgi:hypothetical protein
MPDRSLNNLKKRHFDLVNYYNNGTPIPDSPAWEFYREERQILNYYLDNFDIRATWNQIKRYADKHSISVKFPVGRPKVPFEWFLNYAGPRSKGSCPDYTTLEGKAFKRMCDEAGYDAPGWYKDSDASDSDSDT